MVLVGRVISTAYVVGLLKQIQLRGVDYSFDRSAGKPKLVVDDWLSRPDIAQHIQVESFAPASDELLSSAHDADYVSGVLRGETPNGFGNTSRQIADSLRYTVGSLVAGTKRV